MAASLTEAVIPEICSGNRCDHLRPVLQVIDLSLVQQNSNVERYRLVLSDGSFYQQGTMATQLNELVHSGRLRQGSVVQLKQFLCNVVQNCKVIIIVDLDVILDFCELIGEPVAESGTCEFGFTFGNSHAGGMNARPNVSEPSSPYYPKANPPACNAKAETLTPGAVIYMFSDNCCEDLNPVLQVLELKLVQSQSQHQPAWEMCLLVLSDGSFYLQGILTIQNNELVYSGRLKKGSIVRLTKFFRNRKLIHVIELDIILETCELIGEPVAAPKLAPAESATGQSGNSQSLDSGSHAGGMTAIQNLAGQSLDLKPVLQVLELKLVNTSQQHNATESSFHLVLSDGSLHQQAILAMQKNQLVHSGRLQKGSVVRLTQFTCNVVQSCRMIIVLDLDVVLEKCELFGEPVAAPSAGPSGFPFENSQSLNGLANDFNAMSIATGLDNTSSRGFDFGMPLPANQVGQRQYNNFASAAAQNQQHFGGY